MRPRISAVEKDKCATIRLIVTANRTKELCIRFVPSEFVFYAKAATTSASDVAERHMTLDKIAPRAGSSLADLAPSR